MDVRLAMRKKRELLDSINKRKMSLRKHIDSLKQAECRLDITQITKCVFLGALCLKPVPQLFDSPVLLEELDMKVGNVADENSDKPELKKPARRRNTKKKCLNSTKKKSLREQNEEVLKPGKGSPKRKKEHKADEQPAVEASNEVRDLKYTPPVEEALDEAPVEEIIVIEKPSEGLEDLNFDLYLLDQNNADPSKEMIKAAEYEDERLKGALTPELLLSDSDDDTIDQLMFNIMDIKIGPNVFEKEFCEVAPSDIKQYEEYPREFNEKEDLPHAEEAREKKLIKRTPQCKICSQVFSSYLKLKRHKAAHNGEKPYLCLKCGANHTTLEQLIAHLRTHQGKRPYVCKKCNQGFKSPKALENHQPVHVLRKVVPPKKTFRCEVCGKEFRKLCDLERHTRVHTGEKPSVCNICNRRFQQAHNLNKHLLIHTQEKPYQCDICNKKFGRNDVLNRHLLTHSVKKPNHCETCMKSFIRVSQLMAHKEKYHSEKDA